ncbi:hypothetical protein [Dokdonia sp. Hel_I_53]|uniref:hypothetical protein n=1 Tax=Dokdonia sp. Hel_I_53 TaxID=1566287 RepID=UPI00119A07B1|nr:hypothetical protein [Dokdonia sp. Hel_I_53]TVZ52455.1 hypothetical protein OD90_1630 [Dokdonia sp. Hel_I_53]
MSTKSTNNTLLILVILLCLVVTALGYYTYGFHSEVQAREAQLAEEKERVVQQLEEELSNYNALLEEKNALKTNLQQAQTRLKQLKKTLTSNKITRTTVQKLQIEIRRLRREREFFSTQNDSLQLETKRLATLQEETQKALELVTKSQDSIQKSNKELSERLMQGARLTISNLAARGVIQRNSGKFANTSRANRAEMIQVCFTINENKLTQEGNKTFYVQVSYKNKVIGVQRYEDWPDGTTIIYNTKTTIPYNQEAYTICELVLPIQKMNGGDYTINVYHDQELLISTELGLK